MYRWRKSSIFRQAMRPYLERTSQSSPFSLDGLGRCCHSALSVCRAAGVDSTFHCYGSWRYVLPVLSKSRLLPGSERVRFQASGVLLPVKRLARLQRSSLRLASCWNLASTSSHTADFFSVLALSASSAQSNTLTHSCSYAYLKSLQGR